MRLLTALLLITLSSLCYGEKPSYTSESPLPEGWPAPGPYHSVTEKMIPTYRGAFTNGNFKGFTFMRLFRHIKEQGIPMTSPVEMTYNTDTQKTEDMAFLYQNTEVQNNSTSEKIEILDIPKKRVLSYTWMGADTSKKRAQAQEAIQEYAKQHALNLGEFKMMGYNGPGVPSERKTWEIHASIKK